MHINAYEHPAPIFPLAAGQAVILDASIESSTTFNAELSYVGSALPHVDKMTKPDQEVVAGESKDLGEDLERKVVEDGIISPKSQVLPPHKQCSHSDLIYLPLSNSSYALASNSSPITGNEESPELPMFESPTCGDKATSSTITKTIAERNNLLETTTSATRTTAVTSAWGMEEADPESGRVIKLCSGEKHW
ncbi:unnamed protein product [Protopolystoma xenopodis]|uniref:Uncharacterized protein n=1 Tax=Protopolystoma xenopodis TaxID=117903 RepID=A0A3S5BW95_9PLAT|nr:unnamed protein product [Protopolystoma xenopodis]